MAELGIMSSSNSYSCQRIEKGEEEEVKELPEQTLGGGIELEGVILPCGYRFSPTDQELIVHYLLKKILNLKLPTNIVKEMELYQYDPHELPIREFQYGKTNEAYFFTYNEQKYSRGVHQKRTTASGYWKATGGDVEIFCARKIIGFKKILVFYEGKGTRGKRTGWIMHEYRLNPIILPNHKIIQKIECVICRIRFKGKGNCGMPEQQVSNERSPAELANQIHIKTEIPSSAEMELQIQ